MICANLGRPVEILLVEDNPGDVGLMREAMKEGRVDNRLHVACDGEEAMRFLRRQDPFEQAVVPDLILLDLNLPRKDGREVLAEIKGDPALRAIPVVVLTTSRDEHDVRRAYDLCCNCYIAKPVDLDQFLVVIDLIDRFWLSVAMLPRK